MTVPPAAAAAIGAARPRPLAPDAVVAERVELGPEEVLRRERCHVGPIPVGIQRYKAEAGPTSGPTWRLSHLVVVALDEGEHVGVEARDGLHQPPPPAYGINPIVTLETQRLIMLRKLAYSG